MSNVTFGGTGGNPLLTDEWGLLTQGGNTTYRPGTFAGGARNTATAAVTAGLIPGIDTIKQWGTKTLKNIEGPVKAAKEVAGETLKGTGGKVGQTLAGATQAAPGIGASALKFIAPNAYERAIREGALAYGKSMGAARTLYRGKGGLQGANLLNAKKAANIARMKPGIRIAGGWLGRRAPLIGAGLDLAAGDPLGATGTLAGGAIGGALTLGNPLGIAVGSMVGGPILKGGRQILSPIFGDPNDPLSGRDWSIGGMPLTPYARTKRSMEKQAKLYADIQLPLMEQINNAQFEREMKMAKLGMMQNMMSSTNQLMAQAYQAGAY
tara:strand:- start:89 stop:1057 length:969 start_codon:yes stop_codon:yes gene_type:complete